MNNHFMRLSPEGMQPQLVLEEIRKKKKEDVAWKSGRTWSLVYYAGDEHDALLKAASEEVFSTNYLNPFAFKSLRQMEQEVVQMTAGMLNADDAAAGVMTSGGTESILLAMLCYRQRARKHHPRNTAPEVIVPATVHPAFDKAANLFGLKLCKAPVDEAGRVAVASMEKLVNDHTILVVASAPSYPHGILDPVDQIAQMAMRHKLPMHVDACIGGFMLPWVERLGSAVRQWDFRVPGVTSISADVHKFGYGAKGASVLVYRDMDYMQHQFFVTTDFPGGIYISPTLLGTRPGGPIAAAWAGMKHLGENGYLQLASLVMKATRRLREGLDSIPGIVIIGEPCMNILAYSTRNNDPDIFVVADQLESAGWMVDRQQLPDCIHLTVLPTNAGCVGEYIRDVRSAVAFASGHRNASAKGNAALYGLMARVPFRSVVEKSVRKLMQDLYATPIGPADRAGGSIGKGSALLGFVSRFLAACSRWKQGILRGRSIRVTPDIK